MDLAKPLAVLVKVERGRDGGLHSRIGDGGGGGGSGGGAPGRGAAAGGAVGAEGEGEGEGEGEEEEAGAGVSYRVDGFVRRKYAARIRVCIPAAARIRVCIPAAARIRVCIPAAARIRVCIPAAARIRVCIPAAARIRVCIPAAARRFDTCMSRVQVRVLLAPADGYPSRGRRGPRGGGGGSPCHVIWVAAARWSPRTHAAARAGMIVELY